MTKKLSLFILFLFLITVLFCGCDETGENKTKESVLNISEYGSVYEISEFLDEAQYDEYMNDAGSIFDRVLAFRRQLADSSAFDFYAFANNFVETINHEIPEACIVNHGTKYAPDSVYEIDGEPITAAEAIQVSGNFFSLFPLGISQGRSFEPSDFNCRSTEPIPVILGSAYRGAFRLGETFEGYYLCERRSFTVIGFSDTASNFYLRSKSCMVSYENYIIMPFENIKEASYSANASLLQQLCGFIAPHNSRESALEAIQTYLTQHGLENWRGAIVVFEKSLQDKLAH